MKIIGIVGSNAELSYNRKLLQFIQNKYHQLFELTIIEIKDVPLFNQSDDQTNSPIIQKIQQQIKAADGVIIATPEHNHTIPAALKSLLEWLSFKIHPLEDKPVMIVGASYYAQGSSRAQLHLRQILDAPGVNAMIMPGNEFLLGEVKEAFDDSGNLKDERTEQFLHETLKKFQKFIRLVTAMDSKATLQNEDLHATGTVATTIEGVDKAAKDWVEQASKVTQAVSGNTYIQLDRGVLTVDQINQFLASMPMELTFADENNQFLYYNRGHASKDMLAGRTPDQVGNPLANCHPPKALKNVEWVIQQLRSGKSDVVKVHVPTHGPDKYVVHHYQAIKDPEGNYRGINEYVLDLKPTIDWYLQQTGQKLVGNVDTTTSASQKDNETEVDATTSASQKESEPEVDATTSASVKD